MVCKYFLPVHRFPFHFVYDCFCCAKASTFDYVSFVIFIFISIALKTGLRKHCYNLCQRMLLLMLSSRSFMVLSHFELIYVYGVRVCSNSLIYMRLSTCWRDSLSLVYILASLVKDLIDHSCVGKEHSRMLPKPATNNERGVDCWRSMRRQEREYKEGWPPGNLGFLNAFWWWFCLISLLFLFHLSVCLMQGGRVIAWK